MIPETLRDSLRSTWTINNRVTTYLIENLPLAVWRAAVPGVPRKTVRMIAAHLHNNRCMWIKMAGEKLGVAAPSPVDRETASRSQVIAALGRSSRGILKMLDAASRGDGRMPPAAWQNYPPDVVHFVAYHVVHEGHHRGQIVMAARQLGERLPRDVTSGLWQWSRRSREDKGPP